MSIYNGARHFADIHNERNSAEILTLQAQKLKQKTVNVQSDILFDMVQSFVMYMSSNIEHIAQYVAQ